MLGWTVILEIPLNISAFCCSPFFWRLKEMKFSNAWIKSRGLIECQQIKRKHAYPLCSSCKTQRFPIFPHNHILSHFFFIYCWLAFIITVTNHIFIFILYLLFSFVYLHTCVLIKLKHQFVFIIWAFDALCVCSYLLELFCCFFLLL